MSRTLGLAIGILLLAPAGAATQERALSDTTSVTTAVLLTQPGDVRVDWLELTPNEGVRVTASREYSGVDRLSLTVAKPSISYVRFTRGTYTPITLPAKHLPSDKAWRLPPLISGGELFVTLEPATVMPERFQIVGSNITVEPDNDPAFSVGGLEPGRYTIRPLYAGGRAGSDVEVEIQRGKTTDVRWRAQPLGGADIVADGLRCQFMEGIRIWRENDGPMTTFETTNYPVDPKTCKWRIGGLPLGWYLVSAVAPGGRGPIMMVEIVEQKITSVVIAEPPVRVTGQVTHRGLPVVDAFLMFSTSGEREVNVKTDANGGFTAALPTEGKYRVILKHGALMEVRPALLDVGDNYIDWTIAPSGTIRVTVDGYAPQSNVAVAVERRESKSSRRFKEQRPGAEIEFAGLPFGVYVVTAAQGELRSKPIEIKLDALNDTHDVKVTLQ